MDRIVLQSGPQGGAPPMRKRGIVSPRLESMEDRVVPSPIGGHLLHSASAEIHRLGHSRNRTHHKVRQNVQAQAKTHAHKPPPSKSTFQEFLDSIKSAFN